MQAETVGSLIILDISRSFQHNTIVIIILTIHEFIHRIGYSRIYGITDCITIGRVCRCYRSIHTSNGFYILRHRSICTGSCFILTCCRIPISACCTCQAWIRKLIVFKHAILICCLISQIHIQTVVQNIDVPVSFIEIIGCCNDRSYLRQFLNCSIRFIRIRNCIVFHRSVFIEFNQLILNGNGIFPFHCITLWCNSKNRGSPLRIITNRIGHTIYLNTCIRLSVCHLKIAVNHKYESLFRSFGIIPAFTDFFQITSQSTVCIFSRNYGQCICFSSFNQERILCCLNTVGVNKPIDIFTLIGCNSGCYSTRCYVTADIRIVMVRRIKICHHISYFFCFYDFIVCTNRYSFNKSKLTGSDAHGTARCRNVLSDNLTGSSIVCIDIINKIICCFSASAAKNIGKFYGKFKNFIGSKPIFQFFFYSKTTRFRTLNVINLNFCRNALVSTIILIFQFERIIYLILNTAVTGHQRLPSVLIRGRNRTFQTRIRKFRHNPRCIITIIFILCKLQFRSTVKLLGKCC